MDQVTYQADPSHDGPPLEFYRGRLTWPMSRWEAQERMSEFVAGARITRTLPHLEPIGNDLPAAIARAAYLIARAPDHHYERADEVELCAVCNLWWSTHAQNDWCDPTPDFLPVARCDYPGCLGPADGSECRHPRPEDELID